MGGLQKLYFIFCELVWLQFYLLYWSFFWSFFFCFRITICMLDILLMIRYLWNRQGLGSCSCYIISASVKYLSCYLPQNICKLSPQFTVWFCRVKSEFRESAMKMHYPLTLTWVSKLCYFPLCCCVSCAVQE